tara:strand:- start:1623 stop:2162 length:540 start_codon:yes stop_codon:yes gene_type:complete
MDYFLIKGLFGVQYVVGRDMSVTRNDGLKMTIDNRGATGGFQQAWSVNKKKNSQYFQLGNLYAQHFIPNPDGLKYVKLIDVTKPLSEGNVMWSDKRSRRTPVEILEAKRNRGGDIAGEVKNKCELEVIKEVEAPKDAVKAIPHNPLSKFFLKKENCPFSSAKKKTAPKLDHNFQPIKAV